MRTILPLEHLDPLRQAKHSLHHTLQPLLFAVLRLTIDFQTPENTAIVESNTQAGRTAPPHQAFVQGITINSFGDFLLIAPMKCQDVVGTESGRKIDTASQFGIHFLEATLLS